MNIKNQKPLSGYILDGGFFVPILWVGNVRQAKKSAGVQDFRQIFLNAYRPGTKNRSNTFLIEMNQG